LDKLAGGDLRSIGRSNEVAAEVLARPALAVELVAGLSHTDARVRVRAADALEKASRAGPGLLRPFRAALLAKAARVERKEVRWHLAQMIPRLELDSRQARRAADLLMAWFRDPESRIVRVMALQALVEMARRHPVLRAVAESLVAEALRSEAPSLRARAKRLVREIGDNVPCP
jgi:hypothetical protein